jgi:PAS domain S-box-containing protein
MILILLQKPQIAPSVPYSEQIFELTQEPMPGGIFSHAAIKAESRSALRRLWSYLLAAFLGLLATGFSLLIPDGSARPTLIVAILAVLISALTDGRIAAWIAVATSLAGFFWLRRPSPESLEHSGDLVLLAIFVAVSAVMVEIVQRLRREQRKLIDRDHRLRMAQRAARVWFWRINLSTLQIQWSREALGIEGTKAAESLEAYLTQRVHSEDEARVRQAILGASQERPSFEQEYRVCGPNDELHWIVSKGRFFCDEGQPAMILGMATDITKRKQAEESETRFYAMLSSLIEGVCYYDLNGRVEYLNPAAQVMLQCDGKIDCGRNIHEVVHGNAASASHDKQECPILRATQEGQASNMVEDSFQVRGGRLTVEYNVAPVYHRGELIGAVLSFRDMAERRRAEAALRASEKLANTGRVAATISHELNNPLESVHYLLFLLNQSTNLNEKERNYLQTAEQELGRMGQIVQQTLGFHRQPSSPVPISLQKLLKGILLLYSRKLERNKIAVVERYDFESEVHVFPAEMRQVLSNLIVNAVEAMGEGGRLTLHVRKWHEWKGERRAGVLISVMDNGPGIAKEIREHLFEPFFTTKGEKGTGVGLWVSSGIVQKHRGSIRVRSSQMPGRSYTCFSVFLPLRVERDKQQDGQPELQAA